MNDSFIALCTEFFENETAIEQGIKDKKYRESNPNVNYYHAIFFFSLLLLILRYLMAFWNSKRVGPITREPIIPFLLDGMKDSKHPKYLKNGIPVLRTLFNGKESRGELFAISDINLYLMKIFNEKSGDGPIRCGDRVVSVRMGGFKHGSECHDFVPIDGTSEESYYTYQMFGDDRIQVTNYVEDDVSYVAGFCIYIESSWLWGIRFREKVIEDCVHSVIYKGKTERSKRKRVGNEEEEEGKHDLRGHVVEEEETDRLLQF